MKITFILPPVNFSGGMRVASIYVRRLMAMGHTVVAVSTPPAPLSLRQRLRRPFTAASRRASGSHFDGPDLDHRVSARRPITAKDVPDADIVIATWWETAEWVAEFPPSKGVKVHFVQGYEIFDWLPIERCKASYRLPLHKIVVARWLKDLMEREYGNTGVELVPNSVDHDQFFADERGKQARPTVGFLYSVAPLKGVDVTLRAIATLRSRFPELHVISFGEHTPLDDALKDVEFHHSPPQAELREIYSRCDVWMTASRSEGFNLPAMEAMACRTPVVSTRTGWPEEAIVDGGNGWCVDVDDVNGMTRCVEGVLALSDGDWRVMSARAFDTVRHSTWEASAKHFEGALIRLKEIEPEGACAPAN
jgi:glycosyltransferase involved in cell wall biosynthesis